MRILQNQTLRPSRTLIVSTLAIAIIACATCSTASAAPKDDENPYLWKPQTKSVAVFKNGLGFFMREGDVQLRDGWCVTEQVPPAAFGTLAIHATTENETVDIVGSGPGELVEFDDRDQPSDVETKRKRLEASVNLKVQLSYEYKGQDREAAGKLVSVSEDFVVLDSGSNSFAVPIDGVTKMQILELPLRLHVAQENEQPNAKTRLGMAYLRQGITWVPEYTLKVIDEETAELTLRGTVINEAEDLIHSDIHLVVGVPHFVHTQHLAPIAVGQMIRTIGAAIAPQAIQSQMMQNAAMVSNSFGNNGDMTLNPGTSVIQQPVEQSGGNVDAAMANLPQLDNSVATDYTVYTKSDMTLRRGEKAIVTLFRKKISFSHIYRWTLPGKMQHSLVLKNNTDTAWTTGPCLAVSESRPLSEDLIKYTPRGGNGELPMTDAINISHIRQEEEIDRELKSHNPYDRVYLDLVTLEGRLLLQNYETRPVEVVISAPVTGKPIEASDEGRMVSDSTKLKLEEREGTVTWQITLEPNEKKTLTYKYQRYVPSH